MRKQGSRGRRGIFCGEEWEECPRGYGDRVFDKYDHRRFISKMTNAIVERSSQDSWSELLLKIMSEERIQRCRIKQIEVRSRPLCRKGSKVGRNTIVVTIIMTIIIPVHRASLLSAPRAGPAGPAAFDNKPLRRRRRHYQCWLCLPRPGGQWVTPKKVTESSSSARTGRYTNGAVHDAMW